MSFGQYIANDTCVHPKIATEKNILRHGNNRLTVNVFLRLNQALGLFEKLWWDLQSHQPDEKRCQEKGEEIERVASYQLAAKKRYREKIPR